MEWLADEMVWVLRMGKLMHKPISSNHPRIIDYAFHPERSELLDIWLFANCTGCISTSTGIDSVSHMYGIPMLFVNQMSINESYPQIPIAIINKINNEINALR